MASRKYCFASTVTDVDFSFYFTWSRKQYVWEYMCQRPNIHLQNATGNIFAFCVLGRNIWTFLIKMGQLDWSDLNLQQGLQVFGGLFFDFHVSFCCDIYCFCQEAEAQIHYMKHGSYVVLSLSRTNFQNGVIFCNGV